VKNSTELRAHTGGIERVAWNPTKEAELASCSSDGTVRFWDVRSKTCTASVGVGGEAFTLAWAGDGSVVVVGRKDDTLVPVDVRGLSASASASAGVGASVTAGPELPQSVQTNQTVFGHAVPPRELLVTTGEGCVKVLGWPGLEGLHTLHAHTSACFSLELCPRGRYLAVGGSDALITLWDTTEWVCRRSLSAMVGAVRSLSFSFDGSYVVGGSDEGNGLEIVSSPDWVRVEGRCVVVADSHLAQQAHVETGEYVHTIPTTSPAPYVAWHPSRYWLAYSGDTMGLKIVGAGGGSL